MYPGSPVALSITTDSLLLHSHHVLGGESLFAQLQIFARPERGGSVERNIPDALRRKVTRCGLPRHMGDAVGVYDKAMDYIRPTGPKVGDTQ